MNPVITRLQCVTCAAPLAVLGNRLRSKTVTCQYCGTVMDCQDELRALYAFRNVQQPQTKLRIGMQGRFHGVLFQIAGFVIYRSIAQNETHQWLHFQCYSPTHGYLHLVTWGEQCLVLRRTYHLPNKNLWLLKSNDRFEALDKPFKITQHHFAEIFYAAGTLTESIKHRQRNKQCFAFSDEHCYLSIQRSRTVEYYCGEVLPMHMVEDILDTVYDE